MGKQKDFHILAKIHNTPLEEAQLIYLEPGNRLGPHNRYEIIDLLGIGSIGAVYLVKDSEAQEALLALKMLLPYMLLASEEKLAQFIEYLAILQEIENPNILKIKDFWKQNSLYFYTTEYVEGPSWSEWLQDQQRTKQDITWQQASQIMLQLCEGLETLHKHSAHNLLHPNNLLFANSRQLKICDFGCYYLQGRRFWREASILLEREVYQAPEYTKESVPLDVRGDIYTLGILLYEILTYTTPASREEKLSTIRRDIPLAFDGLLHSALQEDPEKRPKNIQEFKQRLQEILANPTVERKDGTTEPQDMSKQAIAAEQPMANVAPNTQLPSGETPPTTPDTRKAKVLARRDTLRKTTKIGVLPTFSPTMPASMVAEGYTYSQYVEYAEKFLVEKRLPEAVRCWENAQRLSPEPKVGELLQKVCNLLRQAEELKNQAKKNQTSPLIAATYLRESLAIYPYDLEAQHLMNILTEENNKREAKVQEILAQGDKLVDEKKYTEALRLWKTAFLLMSSRDKEVHDRIMQVVDMLGEEAKNMLDSGKPLQAHEILTPALAYTEDPMIKELASEVGQEMKERMQRFERILKEGEQYCEKHQFTAAMELWQSHLGIVKEKEEFLLKKITEAKKMQDTLQQDEEEYLKLFALVRTLEQREDFPAALQTLERMRQKQSSWLCPTQNLLPDIERVTKLAAAGSASKEALKILEDAHAALAKKDWRKTTELLNHPVFRRQLLASAEEKYHNLEQELRKKLVKRKRIAILLWMVMGGVVVAAGVIASLSGILTK